MDGRAGVDAAPLGHPDVHQDDVGKRVGRLLDGFAAVAGLADDLDVGLLLEDHLQPAPEQGVVVDDQDADRLDLQSTGTRGGWNRLGLVGHSDLLVESVGTTATYQPRSWHARPSPISGTAEVDQRVERRMTP